MNIVGLIPAAGIGKRLFPFTRAVPKEMYPILGKAVIEHAIETLRFAGITKVFIVVGYQKGTIMDYLGNGKKFGIDIAYIYQEERRGLGHAVLQGEKWINGTFVVLLGDSFIEPKKEAKRIIDIHKEKKPLATILLFRVNNASQYGIVKMENIKGGIGDVVDLYEKPTGGVCEKFKINNYYYAICGFYIFKQKIFDYIKKIGPGKRGEIELTDAIKLAIDNGERVVGVELRGGYMDIGKWSTVLRVEKALLKMYKLERIIKEREDVMRKVIKNGD